MMEWLHVRRLSMNKRANLRRARAACLSLDFYLWVKSTGVVSYGQAGTAAQYDALTPWLEIHHAAKASSQAS